MSIKHRTSSDRFGTKRGLEVTSTKENCMTLNATVSGKKQKFTVCAVGASGSKPTLVVGRTTPLFRGGKANVMFRTGGMTACSNQGEASNCIRSRSGGFSITAGGAGQYRRKGINVLNGVRRKCKK